MHTIAYPRRAAFHIRVVSGVMNGGMNMRNWVYKVIVKTTDSYQMTALLDMLRYDSAIISDWTYGAGEGNYIITFYRPDGLPATVDRWATFGITPRLVAN